MTGGVNCGEGRRTRLGINVVCSSGAPPLIYIGWGGGVAAKGARLGRSPSRIRSYLGRLLASPLPLPPIYMWGVPLAHTRELPSRVRRPPPQFTPPVIFSWCLGLALRGSLHHRRHHAFILTELIYYLDVLLDQEDAGRH